MRIFFVNFTEMSIIWSLRAVSLSVLIFNQNVDSVVIEDKELSPNPSQPFTTTTTPDSTFQLHCQCRADQIWSQLTAAATDQGVGNWLRCEVVGTNNSCYTT